MPLPRHYTNRVFCPTLRSFAPIYLKSVTMRNSCAHVKNTYKLDTQPTKHTGNAVHATERTQTRFCIFPSAQLKSCATKLTSDKKNTRSLHRSGRKLRVHHLLGNRAFQKPYSPDQLQKRLTRRTPHYSLCLYRLY